MNPEVWARVEEVLEGALEQPLEARTAYLEAEVGGEPEVRRQVETLLLSEESAVHFIERPIFSLPVRPLESDFEEGSRIGAYRVLRPIGQGGMGKVYLAERADETFEKKVAIKVLRRGRDSAEIVRRFRHERQILAQLDHPNIAKLLDGGTTVDGRPYFVLEYVQGVRIDHYCDGQQLSISERVRLFRKVCAAVGFAHQNLVIHRDLKPGNILVNASGEPVLLDFGIAKLLDGALSGTAEPTVLTETGSQPMTPRYASPEQIEGRPVTTASDVYSLGILLYELLTGHRTYATAGVSFAELRRIICETEPERPSAVVGQVAERREQSQPATPETVSSVRASDPRSLKRQLAGDLDSITLKALRKEPRHRYATVEGLSEDLYRHLEGLPVLARQGDFTYRTYKFVRRHQLALAVAAALAMTFFSVALGVLWTQAVRAVEDRNLALEQRDSALEVSQFLVDRFDLADPAKGEGAIITARELLDAAVVVVETREELVPQDQAALAGAIGRAYLGLDLYTEARPHLERSLFLREERGDQPSSEMVVTMFDLAYLLHELGESKLAESYTGRALDHVTEGGVDSRRLAGFLNNRGSNLANAGDLEAAEVFLRQALAMKARLYGQDELELDRIRHSLASVLNKRGKLEEAEQLFRKNLSVREKYYGRQSAEVARVLSNLVLLLEARNPEAAEAAARESLEIRRELGWEPLQLAVTQNNLAVVLRFRGRFEESETIYREVLALLEAEQGERHRTVGFVLVGLSSTLLGLDRPEEAEELARRALDIFHYNFDDDHWRIATAESALGGSLLAQGRIDEAEPLLRHSREVLEEIRGPKASATLEAAQRVRALEGGGSLVFVVEAPQ